MNTFDRLVSIFTAVFDEEIDQSAIKPESLLNEDIGINSIGMLYMAMALEEEFGIKFSNDDFVSIRTVNDVITCVEAKL